MTDTFSQKPNWHRAALGLGSNMGDTKAALETAIALLQAGQDIRLTRRSSDYRTPPWGPIEQDDFRNACILVETSLSPQDLLKRCLETELKMGRVREERWGPRLLDIDVLLYGDTAIDEPDLTLPHPRMAERAFVLVPLAEIWPDAPVKSDLTAKEALKTCPDLDGITKLGPTTSE
ncbi:2-amino-4-hydroxy-6-hydroxymethyldihydropteridine pyrophosphokinase [Roseibium sp. TrichSKD4]|uniref:2-amino-4-hydroxy-6- hydroxymethyldihydropteridine diphosphokinase n=1 Tax=Roseibium sp. TrichSKD4 TaxID=744980 RepID=UPI0001E564CB|nr:2-amino-4-hydroxy-6-hydroxymethyldihydropteridine diphosphokinase [Roseibium sp. TrichSKD4]EFO33406.1 2-amino-4-hydroxy-6-hydroxymethyldihydropteridine pyrophosphokinase [Roseibium sp. TrichSKD4]